MTQNLLQKSNYKDEIDLREIIKIILESKKLIVSTILIFTIASIIYSVSVKPKFETSKNVEIGYIELENGDKEFIESTSNLISNLKIFIIKNLDNKFNQNISISSLEGNLIQLKAISNSAEKNENSLIEIFNYIDERHSKLQKLRADQNKTIISLDIENTKAEINHFKSKLSSKNQSQYLDIISNLEKEDQAVENLKLLAQNSLYSDQLFSLNQKLKILIQNLENTNSQIKSKTQIIGTETHEIKPKYQLMILLSIFIGMFTGILLTFINNFIKSYRES